MSEVLVAPRPTEMPDQQAEYVRFVAQAELKRREYLGTDYRLLVSEMNARYMWYRHCVAMWDVLWRIINDELKRVMFFMPPRHGKSETISKLFPAAYLFKHPERFVGMASYAAQLSFSFSKIAREYFQRTGLGLHPEFSGVEEWRTKEGGGVWSAGIGGPITGKGAHLLIIDDPVKNPEEAFSPTIQARNADWYDAVWSTRQEPDAAMLFVLTRWCDLDLAGYILSKAKERGERWHIVNFPAIAEAEPPEIPQECTVEPDWRSPGEPLCPERYDLEKLEVFKKNSGRFWLSIYQQRTKALEGDVWKAKWFEGRRFKLEQVVDPKHPEHIALSDMGYDWDLAYTEDEQNSACAYVKAGTANGAVYVLDVGWRWLEFPELVTWMRSLGGPNYIENKASGKSAAQVLRKSKMHAREVQVGAGKGRSIDKVGRAKLASVAAETGQVFVAEHVWAKLLTDPKQGILLFPKAEHDDVNDALVQAINRLWGQEHFWFHVPSEDREEAPKARLEVKPEDLVELETDEAGNLVRKRNGTKKKGAKQ